MKQLKVYNVLYRYETSVVQGYSSALVIAKNSKEARSLVVKRANATKVVSIKLSRAQFIKGAKISSKVLQK